ncbi:PREDICTED: serine/threonine-protein kinase OSR1 isoform X2 [Lupinus angustifolius]|uniref:serine/threonine-protein kinase OSR1 isoform X2 n=1 Tax=Lupinus angustifolius TaxID=3871 RepID=UPI00092EE0E1|nr:PREDICTED: serine/threonine-protein kinase OSR1 isoform X2 [Lupinus angustifolius]
MKDKEKEKEKETSEKKKYPIGAEHYVIYEEIGQGVSASVHRALCIPFHEVIAIKILDFERDNCDLNNVSREAQTMILVDHPNVLKSHCSFVSDHNLWVVMPFMSGGSCLHILKAAHPDGFEELVIATILREVLKGLEYLHHHGHIHRDVKAGNILIDSRGSIKLGDFGVSACLFDSGDRQRTRNTFVGTPCWMAPEVMEQLHGYNFKADIWSFGITALELAHGHAPFSKFPPMKVLLMTLQNAPPGLDYERDRKFSKSFKQMIASCLVKDPTKRPSASKLLKHPFFKQARSNDYIARTLLEGLPALGDRMEALKRKEEDMLAQKKMPDGKMEELSQNEYKRGISGWNFNLEDMKAQASLIQDFDDAISDISHIGSSCSLSTLDGNERQLPNAIHTPSQSVDMDDKDHQMQNQPTSAPVVVSSVNDVKTGVEKSDDDSSIASSSHEQQFSQNSSSCLDDHSDLNLGEKPDIENGGRSVENIATSSSQHQRRCSSSILPEVTLPPIRAESDKVRNLPPNSSNGDATSVPQIGEDVLTELPSKVSKSSGNSDDTDEKAKVPVVQQRGRFKVTSENVDPDKVTPSVLQKSHSMQVGGFEVISQHNAALLPTTLPLLSTPDNTSSILSGCSYSLFPVLHSVLQTNIHQRETILSLMKQITAGDPPVINNTADGSCTLAQITAIEKSSLEAAHDREKELLHEITELQWRLVCTQEELQKLKTENAQV